MFSTNHKTLAKYALIVAALAFTTGLAQSQDAQDLPEGRGKAEFSRICSQCHAVTIATRLRMTEDGWSGIVDDMVSKGAQGTDDEFDRVVKYLAAHFGPNNPGGSAKQSTPIKVNINKASEKAISAILGLTAADAQAIVHYRETSGEFADWHDLEKVPNIDMKKLTDQKDRIEFKAPDAAKDRK
jgi:competence ComEA-like helix-hairpin-helix protein